MLKSIAAALWLLLVGIGLPVHADEVLICYKYGCNAHAPVRYRGEQLHELRLLLLAPDAAAERAAISAVIGRMYAIAGEQSPIWRDKGGNFADRGEDGQMDCIDHSTNTTTFLDLLQAHDLLRFHELAEPVRRIRYLVAVHWAARIRDKDTQRAYAVDSWYHDNGRPALVIPVEDWRSGKIPDGP